jgi:hypothetical protein
VSVRRLCPELKNADIIGTTSEFGKYWPGAEIGATVGVDSIASPFVICAVIGRFRVVSVNAAGMR